jgi:hypothetical protein
VSEANHSYLENRNIVDVVWHMGMSSHRRKQANQGASVAYRLPLKLIAGGLFFAIGLLAVVIAALH